MFCNEVTLPTGQRYQGESKHWEIEMNRRDRVEQLLKGDEFIFESPEMHASLIHEMVAKGLYPVCSECGARLEFALSPAEARSKAVAPGVRCPQNLNHCQIVVEFAAE
jgi:hypothetical protein